MLQASKVHLAEANETYVEHMRFAVTVAMLAIGAGVACLLHSIVPALCQRTCSRTVGTLQRLFADRTRLSEIVEETSAILTFVRLLWISSVVAIVLAVVARGDAILLLVLPQAFVLPVTFVWANTELSSEASLAAC
jgi:hypothetical protein